jgi:2-desacetyl-2-hydroxyethyl bacteriochlorophyllide A dehydrogenase
MKALVYEAPREMHLREVDDPSPGPDDVVIKVAYSGICGSELSGYLGQNSLRRPPAIFGHEFSGTIAALGDGVRASHDLEVGQRVTANPLVSCGRCPLCLRGQQQLCRSRALLSAHLPGSNAELVKVRAIQVHRLPDRLSLADAAQAEPAACAIHAVRLATAAPQSSALVVGAGPIGLLIIQVLRLHGAATILVSDLNEERLSMASALGARPVPASDAVAAAREATGGIGPDIVFDAVGSATTRADCLRSVAPGGSVVLVGLHDDLTPLALNALVRDEIACLGSFSYSPHDFATAIEWLAGERLGLREGVVTSPLEEGVAWFDRLLEGAGVAKVLLVPPAG